MRKAALGRVVSEETRAKLKDASLGRKLLMSTILKIRSYRHTEEAIIKIRWAVPLGEIKNLYLFR
jgi:hypothetical protein